jgi:hypothetical protein
MKLLMSPRFTLSLNQSHSVEILNQSQQAVAKPIPNSNQSENFSLSSIPPEPTQPSVLSLNPRKDQRSQSRNPSSPATPHIPASACG